MLKVLKIYCMVFIFTMIESYKCRVFYRISNLIKKAFEALNIPRISDCLNSEKFVDFVCILEIKC